MNIIFAAYSYIAAIVGAGFASGQEILSFFVVYGRSGFWGILLSCTIFACYAYIVIESSRIYGVNSYASFLKIIVPKSIYKIFSVVTLVFLCAVYSAMLACIGELTRLLFGIDALWGILLLSVVCFLLIVSGRDASLKTNAVFGIIIAAGIVVCSLYILRYREHQTFSSTIRAGLSSVAYSGYNLLGAGVVLTGFADKINSKHESASVGILSGSILFVMMFLVWALLSLYYKYISLGEIPMLTMAMRQNSFLTLLYSIMLSLAVLTTAVASGIGICDIAKDSISPAKCAVLLFVCGICISSAGFSHIINIVYRICGYIGAALNLAIVFILFSKKHDKQRYTKIN